MGPDEIEEGQHNGQKKYKGTNYDLQNTTQKTKYEQHEPHYKSYNLGKEHQDLSKVNNRLSCDNTDVSE